MKRTLLLTTLVAGALLTGAPKLQAHCDSMDGPVIVQAKVALERKDLTPVLKWIQPAHEPELKKAFARTLSVRTESKAARELADQFFFETLVRLHRLGEGAPYTGLKPAGAAIDPAIEAADQALEMGAIEPVVKNVTTAAASGIRTRFAAATETRKHSEHTVQAGRDYVAAYVDYVHYVEALHQTATRAPGHVHTPELAAEHAGQAAKGCQHE